MRSRLGPCSHTTARMFASVELRRSAVVIRSRRCRPSAAFDSRRQRLHCVCERATQPSRLVIPDLFKDGLAKLTEHAAHVDMIIGAVAQYGFWVTAVAQWLSGMRELQRVIVVPGMESRMGTCHCGTSRT